MKINIGSNLRLSFARTFSVIKLPTALLAYDAVNDATHENYR